MSGSQDKAELFLRLLMPLQRSLATYARRILRDRSQTEDAIQAAIATGFARFDQFVEGTNFKAWMFRILTLEIFNRNRKHEPLALGEVPVDLPVEESYEFISLQGTFDAMLEEPDVVLEHFDAVVVQALTRLAPLERASLLLRSVGELSYQEIHEVLSIPLGSVMGYLSRARKRLRLSLAEYAAAHRLYRAGPLRGGREP